MLVDCVLFNSSVQPAGGVIVAVLERAAMESNIKSPAIVPAGLSMYIAGFKLTSAP